jgi:hypothetical protein
MPDSVITPLLRSPFSPMSTLITINAQQFETLDLSPVTIVLEHWIGTQTLFNHEQSIQFQIDYPQDSNQAQELPDVPEIRLWFLRLDSIYPWLPYWLDWKSGELVRYAAMMVPHEFSQREGILFNPQALDLFVMQKIFVLHHWLKQQNITRPNTLKQMAELFGYELEDSLFTLLDERYIQI